MEFIKNNYKGLLIGSIGLTLLFMSGKKAMHYLKDNQQMRGCDPNGMGCGNFGASRSGGKRKHKGIDIVFAPGEIVKSPISGLVTRYPFPYDDDPNYFGIEIQNSLFTIKMFYLKATVSIGSAVSAGSPIAKAQNITAKHGASMTNHVHIEVYNRNGVLIDPTNLF